MKLTCRPGEKVQDLDWTTTSDLQSVLAVGFAHRVVLVCEQRLSYTETTPGWAPFLTIDLEQYAVVEDAQYARLANESGIHPFLSQTRSGWPEGL